MHSISTVLVTDIYRKLRPNEKDAKYLKVARAFTIAAGVFATVAALTIKEMNPASLWMFILFCVGFFGSTLTGVFVLGIFTKRAHASGTAVGVVVSIITLVVLRNLEEPLIHGILTAAVGMSTCVIVGYIASCILPSNGKSVEGLTLSTIKKQDS